MQALAFSLEHQLLIEAGEDRLRNGRRLRIAAAGAGVLHTRAENDRIDDLDDAGRAGAVDDGLLAEAAAFAAEEGLCLAFAAEKHKPLRENGKAGDGVRAAAGRGRFAEHTVVIGDVHGVVAGVVRDRLDLDADVHQLHIPGARAGCRVQSTLGIER